MFSSTSVQGNLHEAVVWVNAHPKIAPFVFQFVQQIPQVVGIVFRTTSREELQLVRRELGQTMAGAGNV